MLTTVDIARTRGELPTPGGLRSLFIKHSTLYIESCLVFPAFWPLVLPFTLIRGSKNKTSSNQRLEQCVVRVHKKSPYWTANDTGPITISILDRKWSRSDHKISPYWTANDPGPQMIAISDRQWSRTTNGPHIGLQMIPDQKWFPYWTANDPHIGP